MKRALVLCGLMVLAVVGCSGQDSKEVWPKVIEGKDYKAIRIDTEFYGSIYGDTMEISYDIMTEEIIHRCSLIARIIISEEPVEYNIEYLNVGQNISNVMMAYIGTVKKVYYSNKHIKKGDNIKFLRQEFMQHQSESEISRSYKTETVQLGTGEYILFLEDYSLFKKADKKLEERIGPTNQHDAFEAVAPYYSVDPCRDIISCLDNSFYVFEKSFTSLTAGAIEKYGSNMFVMYEKQDANFDDTLQKVVDRYT